MGEQSDNPEFVSSSLQRQDALRFVSEESPCPYLPDRMARTEAYLVVDLSGEMYEALLERGFRRSGRVVYRPACRSCKECRQLRVDVARFVPTRSMARVQRRNRTLRVEVERPVPTHLKHELFCRYLNDQHDSTMSRSYDTFVDFLYHSPTDSYEFAYYAEDRLIGISIADRLPHGLSSVYMYFDPAYRERSLGTFSVLWEIDYCLREKLSYYYLGYYISDCRTMSYKARFKPNEVLVDNQRWVSFSTEA